MAVAPVITTTTTPQTDAGAPPVGICPGECLPDDPAAKECAEPVVIDLQFASQLVNDAGALSSELHASMASDAGLLDASVSNSGASNSESRSALDVKPPTLLRATAPRRWLVMPPVAPWTSSTKPL